VYLSDNLRYLRKLKNISADIVAKAIQKSKMTIFDYESGRSLPPITIILTFCEFYDIDLNSLVLSNLESNISDSISEIREPVNKYNNPDDQDILKRLTELVKDHQRKIDALQLDIDILKEKGYK